MLANLKVDQNCENLIIRVSCVKKCCSSRLDQRMHYYLCNIRYFKNNSGESAKVHKFWEN